jgi:Golgi nucleoside diphosphatase
VLTYYVVVDVGSSGIRALVYPYVPVSVLPAATSVDSVRVTSSQDGSVPVSVPTIFPPSMFKENVPLCDLDPQVQRADIHKVIKSLLHNVKLLLHPSLWVKTPVHYLATGGCREKPAHVLEQIFQVVRETTLKSGFVFKPSWVTLLHSDLEGVYSWIALNYANGVLSKADTVKAMEGGDIPASRPERRTAGVVELGGQSMQITYQPDQMDFTDVDVDASKVYQVQGKDVLLQAWFWRTLGGNFLYISYSLVAFCFHCCIYICVCVCV